MYQQPESPSQGPSDQNQPQSPVPLSLDQNQMQQVPISPMPQIPFPPDHNQIHQQPPMSPMPFQPNPNQMMQQHPQAPMQFPPMQPQMYPPQQQPFYPPMDAPVSSELLPEAQASGLVVSSLLASIYSMSVYVAIKELYDARKLTTSDDYFENAFKADFFTFIREILPDLIILRFLLTVILSTKHFYSGKSAGHNMSLITVAVLCRFFMRFESSDLLGTFWCNMAVFALVYLCYADDSKFPFAKSLRPWVVPEPPKSKEA